MRNGELYFDAADTSLYANNDGEFRLTLPNVTMERGKGHTGFTPL